MKNLIYLYAGEAVSKVATFAAIAYLARVLGPVGYGYIEFASALLFCAALFVDQGFSPFGAREIARSPHQTLLFAKQIILARCIMAIAAYAGVISFVLLFGPSAVVARLLLVFGLGLLGTPFLLQWVFQGHEQMHIVAAIHLIRPAVFALLVFLLVHNPAQIIFAAAADVAGVICAALVGLLVFVRQFRTCAAAPWTLTWKVFLDSAPIGLSQMFWVLRMYGATFVLGIVALPEDVGFFGSAMRILVALHTFIWLYYVNLLPALSRNWPRHDEKFHRLISRSLRNLAWLASIGTGGVVLAPTLISAVYGSAFAPAGRTLGLLFGVFVMAALSGHYRFGLIAAGRQTAEMVTSILGSVVAVILIPILYPVAGHSGAAVALLVGEAVVLGSSWWWARRELLMTGHLMLFIGPSVVAAASGSMLVALPLNSDTVRASVVMVSAAILAIGLDKAFRTSIWSFVIIGRNWVSAQLRRLARAAT